MLQQVFQKGGWAWFHFNPFTLKLEHKPKSDLLPRLNNSSLSVICYLYLWIHSSSLTEHVALAVQHLKWRPVVRIKYSSMATYMHNTYFSLIFWKKVNEETNSVFSCVPKTTQTKANMFFQIVTICINNGYGLLFCIYLFICFVGSVSSDYNAVDANGF